MKIGFLTFEQFHGKRDIGSTRIRCHWPVKYWPEAEIHKMGGRYDVIIYQKVYWIEHAKQFNGIKILDLCDPDWFHWGHRVKQMIDLCDAVTTSTMELAKAVTKFTDKPVWYIPDRLDPEIFDHPKKVHEGPTKVAAWYGYSENFPMLLPALNILVKLGFEELIVIASKRGPFKMPSAYEGKIKLTNLPWTPETVNTDLQKADIIINPKGNKARWKYKSNNKSILAWALGLPVAHNEDELKGLMTEEARKKDVAEKTYLVEKSYNVKESVEEYKNLIKEIYDTKNAGSKVKVVVERKVQ